MHVTIVEARESAWTEIKTWCVFEETIQHQKKKKEQKRLLSPELVHFIESRQPKTGAN